MYCIAVTVCSSAARSMPATSWAAACVVQSSVTASAALSCPRRLMSLGLAEEATDSARHACWPAALSSGSRSSYPGMPYMVAANGLACSHRSWNRSARSRASVIEPSTVLRRMVLDRLAPAGNAYRVAGVRPEGDITRGTTNPGRLRRVDRWITQAQRAVLRASDAR